MNTLELAMEAYGISLEEYRPHPSGTKIRSHYRSAIMEGTIKKCLKRGTSPATTLYEIQPNRASHHAGEPATVHRWGDKITVIQEFSKHKASTEEFLDLFKKKGRSQPIEENRPSQTTEQADNNSQFTLEHTTTSSELIGVQASKSEIQLPKKSSYVAYLTATNKLQKTNDLGIIAKRLQQRMQLLSAFYDQFKPKVFAFVKTMQMFEERMDRLSANASEKEIIPIFEAYETNKNLSLGFAKNLYKEWKAISLLDQFLAKVKEPTELQVDTQSLSKILKVYHQSVVKINTDLLKNNLDEIHVGFDYSDPPFRHVADVLRSSKATEEFSRFYDEMYVNNLIDVFAPFEEFSEEIYQIKSDIEKIFVLTVTDASKQEVAVANEAFLTTAATITAGAVLLGLASYSGRALGSILKKSMDSLFRENKQIEKTKENLVLEKDVEKVLGLLKNDAWLDKQKFRVDSFSLVHANSLVVDSRIDNKILDKIEQFTDSIPATQAIFSNGYESYKNAINSIYDPVLSRLDSANDAEELLNSNFTDEFDKANIKAAKVEHPAFKLWSKIPNPLPGNRSSVVLNRNIHQEKSEYIDSFVFKTVEFKGDKTVLPLDRDGIKRIVNIILKIRAAKVSNNYFFANAVESLYAIPSPQDGFPETKIDLEDAVNHPLSFDEEIYKIGSLTDQAFDPLFELEDQYENCAISVINALIEWASKSINYKIELS